MFLLCPLLDPTHTTGSTRNHWTHSSLYTPTTTLPLYHCQATSPPPQGSISKSAIPMGHERLGVEGNHSDWVNLGRNWIQAIGPLKKQLGFVLIKINIVHSDTIAKYISFSPWNEQVVENIPTATTASFTLYLEMELVQKVGSCLQY